MQSATTKIVKLAKNLHRGHRLERAAVDGFVYNFKILSHIYSHLAYRTPASPIETVSNENNQHARRDGARQS